MKKSKLKKLVQGFTVVELLIATAVFSVVLLVAQTSFVRIGHLFYKGVTITQTQDVAAHIFQDINGNFQNAPNVGGSQNSASGGYDYLCVGNARYTYRINNEINTDNAVNHSPSGNYGILKDVLPGSGSQCAAPCDQASGNCTAASMAPLNNPTELLGNNMRVEKFAINQSTSTSNLYTVEIILAYGDDNALTYTTAGDYSTVACQGDVENNFCAVSHINTAMLRNGHTQ
jgi:prepilin-type N-terminal cleavage/methylation domain-containing protein